MKEALCLEKAQAANARFSRLDGANRDSDLGPPANPWLKPMLANILNCTIISAIQNRFYGDIDYSKQ
jgi:hypothetical protein